MKNSKEVILINMEKDVERRAFMERQLNRERFNFIIQKGSVIKDKDDVGINFTNFASFSEAGCAMSHKKAIVNFLKTEKEIALIMEDDIEIPDGFHSLIDKQIELQKKYNWEYLSFNYPAVGVKFIRLWLNLLLNKIKKNFSFNELFRMPVYFLKFIVIIFLSIFEKIREKYLKKFGPRPVMFFRPLYFAGCYLITRSGAEKLLCLQETLSYSADRVPNVARIKLGLRFLAFSPLVIKQKRDVFGSNIGETVFLDK